MSANLGRTISFTINGDDASLVAALTHATASFNALSTTTAAVAKRMADNTDSSVKKIEGRFDTLIKSAGKVQKAVGGLNQAFGAIAGGQIVNIFRDLLKELTGIDNVAQLASHNLSIFIHQCLGLKTNLRDINHEYEETLRLTQQQFEADSNRFDRLKELQAILEDDPYNNAAIEEAQLLVDGLNQRYGDLGLSVNALTGKIEGMTEAQRVFLATMKAVEKAKLDAAILEQQLNIDKAQSDLNKHRTALAGSLTLDQEAYIREDTRLEKVLTAENAKHLALVRQREALEKGQSLTEQKNQQKAEEKAKQKTEKSVEETKTRRDDEQRQKDKERAAIEHVIDMRESLTDKRLAEVQNREQAAQDRVNAALLAGNDPEIAQAKQALEAAQQEVAKVMVTVSGDEMKAARQAREEAAAAYEEGEKNKVSPFEMEQLLEALIAADKRMEQANNAYTQTVAGVAPKTDLSKVALDTSSFTLTGGTFSAYSAQDLGTSTAQEQVKILGRILKTLDAFRAEEREKEGGLL